MSERRRAGKRAVHKTVSPSRGAPPPPPLPPPRRERLSPPRKNAPPAHRAPVPPPPPAHENVALPPSLPRARRRARPSRRTRAPLSAPARSISSNPSATPPRVTRARARRASPSLPAPAEEQLAADGLRDWELLFPRTVEAAEAQARLRVDNEPQEEAVESLTIPEEHKTMREGEDFADKIYETVMAGQSLSIALKVEGQNVAEQLMDGGERDMLRWWQSGQRLPEVDWERLGAEGGGSENSPLWQGRAAVLNSLYATDCVDQARARAWWEGNDEWTPLATAYGELMRERQRSERWAAKTAQDHFQAHSRWVHANVANCLSNLERARFVIAERLKSLNEDDAAPTRVAIPAPTHDAYEGAEIQEIACDEAQDVEKVPVEYYPERLANGQSPTIAPSGQNNPPTP